MTITLPDGGELPHSGRGDAGRRALVLASTMRRFPAGLRPFAGAQGEAWSRGYEVGARQKTEPAPPTEPLPAPPAQPAPPFSAAPILLGLAGNVLGGLLLFAMLQHKKHP